MTVITQHRYCRTRKVWGDLRLSLRMIHIKYLETANQTSRLTSKWSSYFLRHSGERIDRQTWNQIFLMWSHAKPPPGIVSCLACTQWCWWQSLKHKMIRWSMSTFIIFYQDCWVLRSWIETWYWDGVGRAVLLRIVMHFIIDIVSSCSTARRETGNYAMQLCASQCQFGALKQFQSPLQLFQLMFNLKFKSPAGLWCWCWKGW